MKCYKYLFLNIIKLIVIMPVAFSMPQRLFSWCLDFSLSMKSDRLFFDLLRRYERQAGVYVRELERSLEDLPFVDLIRWDQVEKEYRR